MLHIPVEVSIKKEHNTFKKINPYKIKVNATGSLTINGNSSITITQSSTAPEVSIALINLRIANMNNENTQKELISILNKLKINDDELMNY